MEMERELFPDAYCMPPLYCTCIVKKGEKDVLDRVVGMWTHNRSLVPTHTLMYANTHKYMQSYTHTQSHTHTHGLKHNPGRVA